MFSNDDDRGSQHTNDVEYGLYFDTNNIDDTIEENNKVIENDEYSCKQCN